MTTAEDFALQLALEHGLLAENDLAAARARAAASVRANAPAPTPLALLVREGRLEARQISRLLAQELNLPEAAVRDIRVPADVLALVPRAFARQHRLLPLALDGGVLRVAVADPLETGALDNLGHRLQLAVEPAVAPADEIDAAITRLYGTGDATGPTHAVEPGIDEKNDAPVIRAVEEIIAEAVRRGASDIHLEPLARRFRVRYRVDGALQAGEDIPDHLRTAVIARVKLMAGISIAEKRVPQDGRIRFTPGGRPLDLRVSTLPAVHGESAVLRLLDRENLSPGLEELGFLDDDRAALERLVAQPDGLVLVTGPTGSGKTTTLYACLQHLNRADRKIITVEDPIEYQLAGVNQVPVHADIGMTFAAALRALLRQAPNIVMIGEIRDRETAGIALQAALTGHLVLSTLHTNDAPGAVARLLDLGAKPFLLASALRAVLAQRLVRRVCPHCRPAGAGSCGAGCRECRGTGYRGRIGIFELFAVDDEARRLIHERASAGGLRTHARAAGMRTLREDGARKAAAGLTTPEEVAAVTAGDNA